MFSRINYMKKNPKRGSATKTLMVLIVLGVIGSVVFKEEINTKLDEKRFEVASKRIEGVYKTLVEYNKKANMAIPNYVYTDYEDKTYYKEDLMLKLNFKQFNERTGAGKKVIIRQDGNQSKPYIYIAEQFKDGRRVISINGKVFDHIYKPSDGVKYYGEEYLYKVNGK